MNVKTEKMSKEYKSIVILSILLVGSISFGFWKSYQVNNLSQTVVLVEAAAEQAAAAFRRAESEVLLAQREAERQKDLADMARDEAIRQEALAIAAADKLRKALQNCK